MYICSTCVPSALRVLKTAYWIPQELAFQIATIIWVLGTKPGSSLAEQLFLNVELSHPSQQVSSLISTLAVN